MVVVFRWWRIRMAARRSSRRLVRGGFPVVCLPQLAAGWVGDQVEAFGDRGAGGADPQSGDGGLPAPFGVVVTGGAGEFQHGPGGVDPDPPTAVVLDQVVPSAEGSGVLAAGFPALVGVPVVEL